MHGKAVVNNGQRADQLPSVPSGLDLRPLHAVRLVFPHSSRTYPASSPVPCAQHSSKILRPTSVLMSRRRAAQWPEWDGQERQVGPGLSRVTFSDFSINLARTDIPMRAPVFYIHHVVMRSRRHWNVKTASISWAHAVIRLVSAAFQLSDAAQHGTTDELARSRRTRRPADPTDPSQTVGRLSSCLTHPISSIYLYHVTLLLLPVPDTARRRVGTSCELIPAEHCTYIDRSE